jgi:DNA-binding MarR family transcriptional regulator
MSEGATSTRSGRDKAAEYDVVIALREVTLRLDLVGAEFAAKNGLHATDLRAIIALLDAERANLTATPTWLAKQLRLNSASVTALIDRLERTGHAQRHRESADRRVVSLTVTDRAKDLGKQFFGPLIEQIMAIMDNYGQHDRDAIMRFLAEIADAIPANAGADR